MPATGTLLSWELGLVKSLLHINSLVAHASPKLRFSAERLKRLKRAWKHQILPTLPIRPLVCGVGIKPGGGSGGDLGMSRWKLSRSSFFNLGLGPESDQWFLSESTLPFSLPIILSSLSLSLWAS